MIIFLIVCLLSLYLVQILRKLNFKPAIIPLERIDALSIVIPSNRYSNELQNLLNCLSKQITAQDEILLVFNGAELTPESIHNCKVLSLVEASKKKALDLGIEQARNPYILQLDADVYIQGNFISKLKMLGKDTSTLYQLPVIIKQYPKLGGFFKVEDALLLAQTMFVKPNKQVLAYGAALLYSKHLYKAINPFEGNYHIPSGDDMFFVHKTKQSKKGKVQSICNGAFGVFTKAENTIEAALKQRIRWASKNTHIKDGSFYYLLGLQVILGIILPIIGLIYLPFYPFTGFLCFILYGIKCLADSMLLLKVKSVFGQMEKVSVIDIIYTAFIYPVYSLIIGSIGLVKSLKKHVI